MKLLVRGVNWVGDAVMTMPALRALRRARPDSHISLLVKPFVAPLFENSPHMDEILIYEEYHEGIIGKLRLASRLRRGNYRSAILLQNAFDAAALAFLARIPERAGFDRDGRGFLLTKKIPYNDEDRKMHHIEYYLELLRHLGIEAEYSEPWIYLLPEERLAAREILVALKRPVIGLNPGATFGSSKRWPAERFSRMAERVVRQLDGSVVLFGGRSEGGVANEITEIIPEIAASGRILSLAGKTTLRELSGMISVCDALVTNDSGPMHIGYAVRTPLIAIFGSTDPALTGPPDAGNKVIRRDLKCSPCFERTCDNEDLKCMTAIGVDEVFDALKKVLPKRKAVFLDRDGTICKDTDFPKTWDDIIVFPDIGELRRLKDAGFLIVGVSNQSGIARGIVDEGFVKEVNYMFMREHGFDDFYYCPHHPDEKCPCRKPEPEMLLRAKLEYGIDLGRSYMVGDRGADMQVARAAGSKGVLVATGKEQTSENALFTARNLAEAVDIILKDSNNGGT